MSYTLKKLEDMDVMDDFLMGRLAADEIYGTDFCRIIISTLLQKRLVVCVSVHKRHYHEEAVIDTMVQDILDLLEDYGDISERVKAHLNETNNKDTLKKWHRLAAKVNSMKEFEEMLFPGSVTQ